MKFCVIGAGSGGRAFAAYISSKGHPVSLYNRSYTRISSIKQKGCIEARGALEGFFNLEIITQNLQIAVKDVDVIMVVTPAFAHKDLAEKLAPFLSDNQIIVLNPGRSFGSVEFKRIIKKKRKDLSVIVGETQTLLFTARELPENGVSIIKIKNSVNFS
ncbi:MAG: NAD(P)-binding domain-containing protein, partial [archaeon]|nr:NAD(P)-binding domain-containing protein [archaeon]